MSRLTADVTVTHVVTLTRVFGVVSLVALFVAVASLAYLHVAATGLSPLRNAVSQYGITPFRGGYRAQTVAFGVAAAALAIALGATFHGHGVKVEVILLVVFAVARAVISWSPMDEPGGTRTATGQRHGVIAIVTFVAVALAAGRFSNVVVASSGWSRVSTVSTILGWAMGATLVAMMLSRSDQRVRRYFGAIERLYYLEIIAWLGVVGVGCVTLAR